MNIRRILEKNGFKVEKVGKEYELQQYTPAGEDWTLYFGTLKEICDYAEDYDPEEDFGMWMEARYHGTRGVPCPSELWKDQQWKQELLLKVKNEIEGGAK